MTMILAPQLIAHMNRHRITHAALFDGATGYLSRTFGAPTDTANWSANFWLVKYKATGGSGCVLCSPSAFEQVYFPSDDTISAYDSGQNKSSSVYRDPTAFMNVHIKVVSNAMTIFINGEEVVSNAGNFTLLNSAGTHEIGRDAGSAYGSYYIAEFHFVDGQSLDPTDFTELGITTGILVAKKYSGTYGNNGLHLDFSNAGDLGKDQSGNGNDWTVNGTITQVTSTPTNAHCTWNPLFVSANSAESDLSNGNCTATDPTTRAVAGTLATGTSGKFYWEVVMNARNNTTYCGVRRASAANKNLNDNAVNWTWRSTAEFIGDGATVSYGSTYATNDIIGIELDIDNGTLEFFKNGVSQGVASTSLTGISVTPYHASGGSGTSVTLVTDDADWTYTPNSGFKALCTDNLNPVTDWVGNHFKTVLYTGNGTAIGSGGNTITGVGFQPDFVWFKDRDAAESPPIFDSLRGATKSVYSNANGAEINNAEGLTSFDSDGFTVGSQSQVNTSGDSFVAWCAALPSSETVTSGDISIDWKYNATLGMAIGVYTGSGVAGDTIGIPAEMGALGAPGVLIHKDRNNGATDWKVYHKDLGPTYALTLNSTAAAASGSVYWNSAAPTSSAITLGVNNVNQSGNAQIVIAFWETPFCRIGSYTGNGNANGPNITEMVSPVWFLGKRSDAAGENWVMQDNKRPGYNPSLTLFANLSNSETTGRDTDQTALGLKVRANIAGLNTSGGTYVYVMIGQPIGPTENTAR
nr:hypothetical protein 4 [Rhodospirillaceae bacterium]